MANLKIDDKALQLISDFYEIGGGAQVVTELPEVGEEYTIYELQETKVADFPWLFTEMDEGKVYPFPKLPLLAVENEEDVTYENLKIRSIKGGFRVGVYVKATNKVYQCWWEEAEMGEPDDPDYTFIKEETISKGNIYNIEKTGFVILKDFDYHSISGEESDTLDGTGHFLDGTEIDYEYYQGIVPLVLTDATNKKIILDNECLIGIRDATDEEIPPFVTQVNKIDLSLVVSEGTYAFAPQPKRTIESYWIYTNDKWVNVDEIDTNPSLHKTIFGTLTYTGDEEELQCSLTLEEMADAIAQGNFVVLELYMGDESKGDYYYCAVSEVFVGGEGPDSATIIAVWSFAEGWIVWNSNTGAFAFNNGMM